jgi:membrane protein YqaA with SNARE-associated domain
MESFIRPLAHFFFALGGFGLVLLGVLDSSFLMMPFGNDLLVVALTASHRSRMPYYVAMATLGSTLGVALAHYVSSKGGKKLIEGDRKSKRIEYVEKKIEKYGGWAIGLAALAPPGFPFTPFIVVPAALQYPRAKMLWIIAGCRAIRFAAEGWLALIYGRRILAMAKSPALQWGIGAVVVISIVGSAFSIWGWVQKGKEKSDGSAEHGESGGSTRSVGNPE